MNLVLLLTLCCACPNVDASECLLTPNVSVSLPAEQATVVASSPTSDAIASTLKRLGSRRSTRVVARLERRIARHKRA